MFPFCCCCAPNKRVPRDQAQHPACQSTASGKDVEANLNERDAGNIGGLQFPAPVHMDHSSTSGDPPSYFKTESIPSSTVRCFFLYCPAFSDYCVGLLQQRVGSGSTPPYLYGNQGVDNLNGMYAPVRIFSSSFLVPISFIHTFLNFGFPSHSGFLSVHCYFCSPFASFYKLSYISSIDSLSSHYESD